MCKYPPDYDLNAYGRGILSLLQIILTLSFGTDYTLFAAATAGFFAPSFFFILELSLSLCKRKQNKMICCEFGEIEDCQIWDEIMISVKKKKNH